MAKRVHYVDWLRVGAVLLLFPFHVSRVFNAGEDFYVKSDHLSQVLAIVLSFVGVWHMPLLFFLAGASSYFALRHRSGRQYVGERVKRLLLPFLFGWLVLIPPQTWYGARFNAGYTKSFITYITSGDFLIWNIQDGGDFFGGFGFGHLWFILWLFMISLVALPLILWGRGERGAARLRGFADRLSRPVWWLLAAFIIFFFEALPWPAGPNLFFYLSTFALGYITMFSDSFAEAAEKYRWQAMGTGLLLAVGWVATGPVRDSMPDPSWGRAAIAYGGCMGIWLMLVGFIGLGRRYLDRPSPALEYLAPASYPLYIFHQTVIVVAAFYIAQANWSGAIQWTSLLLVAAVGSFGLYELTRRVPLLCACVGIKRLRAPASAEAVA